ncbi:transcriptional repressor [Streptomyces sp. CB03238]|uniref:Fur family transcriptional regulator n=1 Tax=Streptomyces sp. CB03238 TaxID=1907777 RepID=UPI000A0F9BF3|nr:transcriptional repressor [Streptomyces sp. CB03238]ORT57238.1 transcriptional repressor [Streptomyces sp. CB03238]
MTRQRAAVLEAFAERSDFVSAQELHAILSSAGIRVGLSTVYRALQDLERAGGADVVRDDMGERLYRHRPVAEHRHYLVCRRCRRGQPLDSDVVEHWVAHVARSTGYSDVEHTLELVGICGLCRTNGG